jgi:hypothetical protein
MLRRRFQVKVPNVKVIFRDKLRVLTIYVFGSVHGCAGHYLAMCCLDGALRIVQILWLITRHICLLYTSLHTPLYNFQFRNFTTIHVVYYLHSYARLQALAQANNLSPSIRLFIF